MNSKWRWGVKLFGLSHKDWSTKLLIRLSSNYADVFKTEAAMSCAWTLQRGSRVYTEKKKELLDGIRYFVSIINFSGNLTWNKIGPWIRHEIMRNDSSKWTETEERATENKMSGESYVGKSTICKALIFYKIIFNKNKLKTDKGLLNRSFDIWCCRRLIDSKKEKWPLIRRRQHKPREKWEG